MKMSKIAFVVCGSIGFYDFFIGSYGLAIMNFTLSLINYILWQRLKEI